MEKRILFSDFRDGLRRLVLDTVDGYARQVMGTDRVDGWKDGELAALFQGVDAHAKALAERINAGNEVNSLYVSIDMER